jgi:hypothetical protein
MQAYFHPFRLLATLGLSLAISGCTLDPDVVETGTAEGYRPLYLTTAELRNIAAQPARSLQHPGKIYVHGSYLFINERGKGIHVVNNHNPSAPQPVAFISVPGNADIAVQGNVLYADNATDLVSLDISDPLHVRVLHRVENAFPYQMYPEQTGVAFQCVDKSKGVVVGWEKTTLENPQCRR